MHFDFVVCEYFAPHKSNATHFIQLLLQIHMHIGAHILSSVYMVC